MIIVAVITVFALLGCNKEPEPDPDVLVKVTDPATPTSSPTPSPTPTPIIDVPKDRQDASSRSPEDEEPLRIPFTDEILVLNPFYADSDLAREIVDRTQARLFDVDENGEAQAGVDHPCVAYEYGFIDDRSMFGDTADEAGDDYRVLRVVIKEGITFCDDNPVTASDVVYSAHVLGNKNYDGPETFYENDIYGLAGYRTQISEERRRQAQLIKAAGINEDGSYPDLPEVGLAEQKAFWDLWNEAGVAFANDIVDYVNDHYAQNAYVQAFLANSLTYAKVQTDESLRVAFAFAMWGYMKDFNAKTLVMTDTFDNVYNLDETPLTAEDLYNVIFRYYGYNLDDKTGVNYECPVAGKHFEDYIEEIYLTKGSRIDVISGIATGAYRYPDGSMRGCVYFLVGKDVKVADINLYVVPKHIYLGKEKLNDLKGAGEYSLEGFSEEDNTITLIANDSYMLGSPAPKYIIYEWKPEVSGD